MGGLGSTRWARDYRKRIAVERCRELSVAEIIGADPPDHGRAGTFAWDYRDGSRVTVAYEIYGGGNERMLCLRYHWFDPEAAAWSPVEAQVRLSSSRVPNGGERWWAHCPLTAGEERCERRVAALYQPPGVAHFGCRACHRLVYTSSQDSDPAVREMMDSIRSDPLAGDSISDMSRMVKGLKAACLLILRERRARERKSAAPRRRKKKEPTV